jgi:AcrR family transcriptional regulator
MPASSATRSDTRRLTLETIVDAAAELVAEEGVEALSMRRLARRCGVGAMTLYGYVRTKEELLGALANKFFADLEPVDRNGVGWQDEIAAVFRSVRQVFLQHPELVPIVATQRIDGIAAYRGAEIVLGALRRAGLGDHDVISAFDALTSLTIGSVQRETGLNAHSSKSLTGIRDLPRDEFGNVISLAGELMTRDPERDFEVGLDLLVRGIASKAGT